MGEREDLDRADATNEVGQPHTFTVTLEKDTGTGTFVAGRR